MIGLDHLRDGGHLLDHPEGPIWVLVKKGQVIRAEQYVTEIDRLIIWPADTVRAWAINIGLGARDFRRGVMLAD